MKTSESLQVPSTAVMKKGIKLLGLVPFLVGIAVLMTHLLIQVGSRLF